MRQLKALKWRLIPLALAAVVLCIPLAENALNKHHVAKVAEAAQLKLDQTPKVTKIEGLANRIVIPSLAIDLPVVPQNYSPITHTWPVASSDANYATDTALNNNIKGETLIYGHDNRAVFGPLLNMPLGAEVYVYTNNGHIFKYRYAGSQDVTPTKLSIIDDMAKAPAGLKLITCTGAYFQYRHLMSLKLVQAS
jgi:LPXTG-site transpeptidase (sortase) family protein